jgi:hypothetical protein
MEWRDTSNRTLKELRKLALVPDSEEMRQPQQRHGASGSPTGRLKLQEAMAVVLKDNGNRPMRAAELARDINRRGLYRQRSGAPVPSGQISARLSHYGDIFERTPAGIQLRDSEG